MRQLKITKQITNRENISLEKYLHEIAREELINAEQEVELAKRIKAGDERALDKLTRANLRFVVSVSKQYQHQGLSLPDLINEGNLGLIKAAQKFDETRGFKFISYAVWWIRQSILQALAEQSRIVRLPLNKISSINKLNRTFADLEQQYERPPSESELADILEMHQDDIKETMNISGRSVSMDAPVSSDDDAGNMYDLLENEDASDPDKQLILESLRKEIERSLSTLSQRESEILKYFYGINMKHPLSLEEIGSIFGLTRERVRQIREKAIKKLRTSSKCTRLKGYLG